MAELQIDALAYCFGYLDYTMTLNTGVDITVRVSALDSREWAMNN
jgi:hypothetical protein